MITSRDLIPVGEGEERAQLIPVSPVNAASQAEEVPEKLTVHRKVSHASGGLYATVTLEAVSTATGVVIRSESFRVTQPVTYASTVSKTVQFREELAAEGYEVIDNVSTR